MKRNNKTGIGTDECWVRIGNQLLVFPSCQQNWDGCDYVRIVKDGADYTEVAYWHHTEWEKAGITVMAALMGAICSGIPGYEPRVMPKAKGMTQEFLDGVQGCLDERIDQEESDREAHQAMVESQTDRQMNAEMDNGPAKSN